MDETWFVLAAAVGEIDQALDGLERMGWQAHPGFFFNFVSPVLDPLRGHPRFVRLVRSRFGDSPIFEALTRQLAQPQCAA